MRNITKRHETIIKVIKANGSATIPELIEMTKVSGVTIRKDLKFLEDKNLLFCTRGGASLTNPYANDRPIVEKALINPDKKQKIARASLALIKENDSIMIGSGTTVFELAKVLQPEHPLTVITPAIKVAFELSGKANMDVLQLGGLVRPSSSSVAGVHAEHILENISCGVLFIGVDGIDIDFGLSISNLAEAGLNQKMIRSAQSVAVLADSTKFGKRGIGRICELNEIQYIVTDDAAPPAMIKQIEKKGVKVITAS
ncbi:DeoR/GlpR transcriptional regulator [Olivibacter sp. SDN3]|uniref:DeoR/GlpR family DNA-binding transcription regulator n=1 Tax=Olivibacter sp. SDN3 TaxID=2764720 RepID=UPI0016514BEE|nr:DeoR/GlpR family DNA-binding transcription regulator [Olivibacter sp. SDN3]QNL50439.1 DeoR/GlpR transcriptional regulator [Olivibacter sp. SDN3]